MPGSCGLRGGPGDLRLDAGRDRARRAVVDGLRGAGRRGRGAGVRRPRSHVRGLARQGGRDGGPAPFRHSPGQVDRHGAEHVRRLHVDRDEFERCSRVLFAGVVMPSVLGVLEARESRHGKRSPALARPADAGSGTGQGAPNSSPPRFSISAAGTGTDEPHSARCTRTSRPMSCARGNRLPDGGESRTPEPASLVSSLWQGASAKTTRTARTVDSESRSTHRIVRPRSPCRARHSYGSGAG